MKSALAIVGALVLAVALSFAGSLIWILLFRANRRVWPGLPWSAIVMLAIIFGAWVGLARTPGFRRPLPTRQQRGPAALTAISIAVGGFALVVLGLRISSLTPSAFASAVDTRALPLSLQLARVLLTALTAAFFEEVGFRGYLQSALERRLGVRWSIVLTTAAFYAMHLGHGWTRGGLGTVLGIAVPFWTVGALLALLAQRAQSLAPVIGAHALLDVLALPHEWYGWHDFTPITLDRAALVWGCVLIVTSYFCWLSLRKLGPTGAVSAIRNAART